MRGLTHRERGILLVLIAVLAAWLSGPTSRADQLDIAISAGLYGNVAQNIGGDINSGTVACGPTSVYNSFVYLKNALGVDLTGSNAATTINTLEGYMKGTAASFNGVQNDNDLVNGKINYIQDQGKSGLVTVESLVTDPNAIPGQQAAQFIYDQLAKGQDIEIGFFWSDQNGVKTSGGHWVTVNGIDFNTATGMGTLDIIDPWAALGNLTAEELTANLNVVNGALVLGYTGGAAGTDGDTLENPDQSGYGFITGIAAESVVAPVPTSVWGGLLLFGCVGAIKLRQFHQLRTAPR